MNPKRLLALFIGLALTAAACSGGQDLAEADTSTDTAPAADDAGSAASDDPADEAGSEPAADTGATGEDTSAVDPADLFAPTLTDEPFDLTGGVASSTEGLLEVSADDPQAGLSGDIRQVTEVWPTDWSLQTVGLDELGLGLPRPDPRDGIPPIDEPRFESITDATWIGEREPGALVQFNDEVRFYPLSILTRHEIVNDRFGDQPVVVTFCPLCNTALSFDPRVDGEVLRFGVSGLLRNSDLVMWDESTTTLWQQVTGEAIVGELAGTQLDIIPTSLVSYGDAVENFPEALSLSRATGFNIQYGTNGYVGYSSSPQPFLFNGELDPRFPALSRVVSVSVEGEDKGYPFGTISEVGAVNDTVGGADVAVLWGGDTADALDAASIADAAAIGSGIAYNRNVDGQVLTFSAAGDDLFTDAETGTSWTLLGRAVEGPLAGAQLETITHRNEFWFAWAAFFPEAPIYGDA